MRFQRIITIMVFVLFAFSLGVVAGEQEKEKEKSKEQKVVDKYIQALNEKRLQQAKIRQQQQDKLRAQEKEVVSKYVGETEKNLKQIFDTAEKGGAILLFDEADSLFGKRSEVRDSHDRYANIEVSYLLQRMETYRGLAILTTNIKNSLDKAFLRRIRFLLHFPFPDSPQRVEIWQRIFPVMPSAMTWRTVIQP